MNLILVEAGVILLLFVANGIFAMTELAVVSARKMRLKQQADAGVAGARTALALADAPNRFLPTVQIGITLVGLLAGAFGGITIAEQIAAALQKFPVVAPYAEAIGVACVVVGLTFFSLVIGELVPKRLALSNPERIACLAAGPIDFLSRATQPAIRVLGWSTDFVLWLFRVRPHSSKTVTDEEVKFIMQEGVEAGVFDQEEPRMVESVLAFDQRPVCEIMTPRTKIIFLNQEAEHADVWHKVVVSHHSSFPVYAGMRDHVVGMVSVKSIYANLAAGGSVKLGDLMTAPLLVRQTSSITALLEEFRTTGRHVALVTDNEGRVIGMVTLVDVLEAIVGEMPSLEERLKPSARRREDGSWLVDGALAAGELASILGNIELPPNDKQAGTVADFVQAQLGKLPHEGEAFTWHGWRFEVADMDRGQIDKLLVMPEGYRL